MTTATLLTETEADVAPALTEIVDDDDPNVTNPLPSHIWWRIEAWTNHRWTPREVVWIVEGPGRWQPRLEPATITITETWLDGAWVTAVFDNLPTGGLELSSGDHRITATVGGGTVPAMVIEAARRLQSYLEGAENAALHRRFQMGSGLEVEHHTVTAMAKAMQYSGAADLLRQWRRPR